MDSGIVLDQTAFYPGGGGQPNDVGVMRIGGLEFNVPKVSKKDDVIIHEVQGSPPFVGDTVTGVLDWDRRHKLMRTHTSLHILCGVIWRDYNAQVTGGNMEPLAARMDFEFENMTTEFAQEVETTLPTAVSGNNYVENATGHPDDEPADNGKTINSKAVLAHAVKAIQELEARIATLEG